nr:hypothetical protein [Pseudomonadota bacterium]
MTATLAAAAADAPEPAAAAFVLDTDLLGPLVVPDGAWRAAGLEALAQRVTLYASRARSDGTRRTYRSAWRHYTAWRHALGREPLAADPDTIAMCGRAVRPPRPSPTSCAGCSPPAR